MYFMGAYLRNWKDIVPTNVGFWGAFVATNGIWWIIPLVLIIRAAYQLTVHYKTAVVVVPRKKTD